MDFHYHKDERTLLRLAALLGALIGALAFFVAAPPSKKPNQISPEAVWEYVYEQSRSSGLDPQFVYALAWAESSLNEHARSSVARGIMQLTKSAWREVTDESYRHAWNWKDNVRVGIDYLVFCREFLKQHDAYSYPLLAACFRYGPYYVKDKDFRLDRIKKPKNDIYKLIFSGNIRPVRPPTLTAQM